MHDSAENNLNEQNNPSDMPLWSEYGQTHWYYIVEGDDTEPQIQECCTAHSQLLHKALHNGQPDAFKQNQDEIVHAYGGGMDHLCRLDGKRIPVRDWPMLIRLAII